MPRKTRAEFEVHLLNDIGIKKAQLLAENFTNMLDGLEEICGKDSREMAIVRTKMEEASFFAKKAMANQPENQKNERG